MRVGAVSVPPQQLCWEQGVVLWNSSSLLTLICSLPRPLSDRMLLGRLLVPSKVILLLLHLNRYSNR